MKNKRLFTLIACCIINLCLGSIYSWSVFASSMSVYLTNLLQTEITSADLALVYTVANSVGPITMITGGWFNDHFGPKKVIGNVFIRFCYECRFSSR
jgi:MFS family permease